MRSKRGDYSIGWWVLNLSPILWKKISTGLSAGRVQSVAVRLVVEREREIEKFEAKSSFKVSAVFDLGNGKQLIADLGEKFSDEKEALSIFGILQRCHFFYFRSG
jgi:DNA topoisomerase IA